MQGISDGILKSCNYELLSYHLSNIASPQRGEKAHRHLSNCRPRIMVCMIEIAGDFYHANSIGSIGNGPLAGVSDGTLQARPDKRSTNFALSVRATEMDPLKENRRHSK